jgi:hypothetical protein
MQTFIRDKEYGRERETIDLTRTDRRLKHQQVAEINFQWAPGSEVA